jgi:hypothetical protein
MKREPKEEERGSKGQAITLSFQREKKTSSHMNDGRKKVVLGDERRVTSNASSMAT